MKILQVISYFYPAWSYGGPGKLVYDLAKELEKQEEVTIYSTDAYNRSGRRNAFINNSLKREKFAVRFFRNISNFAAFKFKAFIAPGCIPALHQEIKTFNIVHIHEFFTLLTVATAITARKSKIPYVISAHGTLDNFHLSHRSFFKTVFMTLWGRSILQNASHFVAATVEESGEYELLGIRKPKISVIPNGIDTTEFKTVPDKGSFRKKHNIGSGEKIILYLGRISSLKGLDMLLEAFANLIKKLSVHLVIAGSDDGYLNNLQDKVAEYGLLKKVTFPGVIAGMEKLQMYRDSDIFVYPSPAEGFSIAILEAAAAGLPLVITKGCKFPEVEKYNMGLIVDSEVSLVYNALLKILTDDKLCRQAGLNSRRIILQKYSVSQMAQKLKNLYSSLTA